MNNYPKVEVTALVVSYPGSQEVQTISGADTYVQVGYPKRLMTLEQWIYGVRFLWADRPETLGVKVNEFLDSGDDAVLRLDGPASGMPNIGGVTVEIDCKLLDWC